MYDILKHLKQKSITTIAQYQEVRFKLEEDTSFSLKAFLIQLLLGIVGLTFMFFLEPIVKSFSPQGGNNPFVFWGYLISIILVVIGMFALYDFAKKIFEFHKR